MDESEIDWKKDSRSFDTVAELYDAHRPSYPLPLVETILSTSGIPTDGRILEIGSGTGIATALFARKGYAILCLEPGENLVKIARRKLWDFPRVDFRVTSFEDWESGGKPFDLVISAQAFHWVPKEVRYAKVAQVLRTQGCLALFWNRYPPVEAPIYQKLDEAYEKYAPELASRKSADYEEGIQQWIREIDESEFVDFVGVKRFPWKSSYTTPQYLGLLNTHSDHIRLSEERRQRLLAGIAEVLEGQGGRIERTYEAVVFIARKR